MAGDVVYKLSLITMKWSITTIDPAKPPPSFMVALRPIKKGGQVDWREVKWGKLSGKCCLLMQPPKIVAPPAALSQRFPILFV